jgi:hypothetical protein
VSRTLLYWPEAADDPVVSWLLDEVETDDSTGPEDPDQETPGSDGEEKDEEEEEEAWVHWVPSAREPEGRVA